jgi:hypothetical protein
MSPTTKVVNILQKLITQEILTKSSLNAYLKIHNNFLYDEIADFLHIEEKVKFRKKWTEYIRKLI